MEPAAPSIDVPRTALSAAPWLRVPLAVLCALLAALALPSVASAAPQPDAAPQAPAPAPDPAPQAGAPPPQQTPPAPTTSSPSPAPPTSAAPTTPSAVTPATETPATGGTSTKREARRSLRQRANRQRADSRKETPPTARAHRSPTDPSAIARIGAFLPGSSTDDGRSGHLLFLAACALLALLCASGSFLSVATRISRGQLR